VSSITEGREEIEPGPRSRRLENARGGKLERSARETESASELASPLLGALDAIPRHETICEGEETYELAKRNDK